MQCIVRTDRILYDCRTSWTQVRNYWTFYVLARLKRRRSAALTLPPWLHRTQCSTGWREPPSSPVRRPGASRYTWRRRPTRTSRASTASSRPAAGRATQTGSSAATPPGQLAELATDRGRGDALGGE